MANKITTLNQLQSTAEAAKKYAGGLVSELATTTLEAIEEVSNLKQDKITSGTTLIPPGSAWKTDADPDYPNYVDSLPSIPALTANDRVDIIITESADKAIAVKYGFSPVITLNSSNKPVIRAKDKPGSSEMIMSARYMITKGAGKYGTLTYGADIPTAEDLNGTSMIPVLKNSGWKSDTSFGPYKYSYTRSISSIKATDTVLVIASSSSSNTDAIQIASQMQISPIVKPIDGKLTFYAMANPESVGGNTLLSFNWRVLSHTGSCGAFIFPSNLDNKTQITFYPNDSSEEWVKAAETILTRGIDNCHITCSGNPLHMEPLQNITFEMVGNKIIYSDVGYNITYFELYFAHNVTFSYTVDSKEASFTRS